MEQAMKNPMFLLLWVCSAVGLVLAYYKFQDRQWTPAIFLLLISLSVICMTVWLLQLLHRVQVPSEAEQSIASAVTQNGPILMQISGKALGETFTWAICFLIGAIAVVQYPDLLWKWWLAYPAACVLMVLVAVMLVVVMAQKFELIVADSNGIEVSTEARNVVSSTEEKVAWRDVGAVKIVDLYIKATGKQYTNMRTDRFNRTELVLLDHNGKELLKLEVPLAPAGAYQRFLESIPVWTNLAIQKETVVQ